MRFELTSNVIQSFFRFQVKSLFNFANFPNIFLSQYNSIIKYLSWRLSSFTAVFLEWRKRHSPCGRRSFRGGSTSVQLGISTWVGNWKSVKWRRKFVNCRLQNGASAGALIELRAVKVVWEVNDSSGRIGLWAVQVIWMFNLWSRIWSVWPVLSWWLNAWSFDWCAASGCRVVAEVASCIPVLTRWASDLESVSIVTFKEAVAVRRMRQLSWVPRVLVHWTTLITSLTSSQSDQNSAQYKKFHLFFFSGAFLPPKMLKNNWEFRLGTLIFMEKSVQLIKLLLRDSDESNVFSITSMIVESIKPQTTFFSEPDA